jgi:hypothetical protein
LHGTDHDDALFDASVATVTTTFILDALLLTMTVTRSMSLDKFLYMYARTALGPIGSRYVAPDGLAAADGLHHVPVAGDG